jgi:hypothetical protein
MASPVPEAKAVMGRHRSSAAVTAQNFLKKRPRFFLFVIVVFIPFSVPCFGSPQSVVLRCGYRLYCERHRTDYALQILENTAVLEVFSYFLTDGDNLW